MLGSWILIVCPLIYCSEISTSNWRNLWQWVDFIIRGLELTLCGDPSTFKVEDCLGRFTCCEVSTQLFRFFSRLTLFWDSLTGCEVSSKLSKSFLGWKVFWESSTGCEVSSKHSKRISGWNVFWESSTECQRRATITFSLPSILTICSGGYDDGDQDEH